jgi:hypothetical protein
MASLLSSAVKIETMKVKVLMVALATLAISGAGLTPKRNLEG